MRSIRRITKKRALALFGGIDKMAEGLGVSRYRVYQIKDPVTDFESDRIIGALVRSGKLDVQKNPGNAGTKEE